MKFLKSKLFIITFILIVIIPTIFGGALLSIPAARKAIVARIMAVKLGADYVKFDKISLKQLNIKNLNVKWNLFEISADEIFIPALFEGGAPIDKFSGFEYKNLKGVFAEQIKFKINDFKVEKQQITKKIFKINAELDINNNKVYLNAEYDKDKNLSVSLKGDDIDFDFSGVFKDDNLIFGKTQADFSKNLNISKWFSVIFNKNEPEAVSFASESKIENKILNIKNAQLNCGENFALVDVKIDFGFIIPKIEAAIKFDNEFDFDNIIPDFNSKDKKSILNSIKNIADNKFTLNLKVKADNAFLKEHKAENVELYADIGNRGLMFYQISANNLFLKQYGMLDKVIAVLDVPSLDMPAKLEAVIEKDSEQLLADVIIPSFDDLYNKKDGNMKLKADIVTAGTEIGVDADINNQLAFENINVNANFIGFRDVLAKWFDIVIPEKFNQEAFKDVKLIADINLKNKKITSTVNIDKILAQTNFIFVDDKLSGNLNIKNLNLNKYKGLFLLESLETVTAEIMDKNLFDIFDKFGALNLAVLMENVTFVNYPEIKNFNININSTEAKKYKITGNASLEKDNNVQINGEKIANKLIIDTNFNNVSAKSILNKISNFNKGEISGEVSGNVNLNLNAENFNSLIKDYYIKQDINIKNFTVKIPLKAKILGENNFLPGMYADENNKKNTEKGIIHFNAELKNNNKKFKIVWFDLDNNKKFNSDFIIKQNEDQNIEIVGFSDYFNVKGINFFGNYDDEKLSLNFNLQNLPLKNIASLKQAEGILNAKAQFVGSQSLYGLRVDAQLKDFQVPQIKNIYKTDNIDFTFKMLPKDDVTLFNLNANLNKKHLMTANAKLSPKDLKILLKTEQINLDEINLESISGFNIKGKASLDMALYGEYQNPVVWWVINPYDASVNHNNWSEVPINLGGFKGRINLDDDFNIKNFVTDFTLDNNEFRAYLEKNTKKKNELKIALKDKVSLAGVSRILPLKNLSENMARNVQSQFKFGDLKKLNVFSSCDGNNFNQCLMNIFNIKEIKGDFLLENMKVFMIYGANPLNVNQLIGKIENGELTLTVNNLNNDNNNENNTINKGELVIKNLNQSNAYIKSNISLNVEPSELNDNLQAMLEGKSLNLKEILNNFDFRKGKAGVNLDTEYYFENDNYKINFLTKFSNTNLYMPNLGETKAENIFAQGKIIKDKNINFLLDNFEVNSKDYNFKSKASLILNNEQNPFSFEGDLGLKDSQLLKIKEELGINISGSYLNLNFAKKGNLLGEKAFGDFIVDAGKNTIDINSPKYMLLKNSDEKMIIKGNYYNNENEDVLVLKNVSVNINDADIITNANIDFNQWNIQGNAEISQINAVWLNSRFNNIIPEVKGGTLSGNLNIDNIDEWIFDLDFNDIVSDKFNPNSKINLNAQIEKGNVDFNGDISNISQEINKAKISGKIENAFYDDIFYKIKINVPEINNNKINKEASNLNDWIEKTYLMAMGKEKIKLPKGKGEIDFIAANINTKEGCNQCSAVSNLNWSDKKINLNFRLKDNLEKIKANLNFIINNKENSSEAFLNVENNDFDMPLIIGSVFDKTNIKIQGLESFKSNLFWDYNDFDKTLEGTFSFNKIFYNPNEKDIASYLIRGLKLQSNANKFLTVKGEIEDNKIYLSPYFITDKNDLIMGDASFNLNGENASGYVIKGPIEDYKNGNVRKLMDTGCVIEKNIFDISCEKEISIFSYAKINRAVKDNIKQINDFEHFFTGESK